MSSPGDSRGIFDSHVWQEIEILLKKRNSVDQPIVVGSMTLWFDIHGRLHRDGAPAMIWSDGGEHWYKDGKLHREDGPAFISPNGSESWYVNGNLHREDGPALIVNHKKQWYLYGIPIVKASAAKYAMGWNDFQLANWILTSGFGDERTK